MNPDYLRDLPEWLHKELRDFDLDAEGSLSAVAKLEQRALLHLPERIEVAMTLLDCFDVVEIMAHTTVKAKEDAGEWAWRVYNVYFRLFTAIILRAREEASHSQEIAGTYVYLLAKFRYEKARRARTFARGGWHEFDAVTAPLVELGLLP